LECWIIEVEASGRLVSIGDRWWVNLHFC